LIVIKKIPISSIKKLIQTINFFSNLNIIIKLKIQTLFIQKIKKIYLKEIFKKKSKIVYQKSIAK